MDVKGTPSRRKAKAPAKPNRKARRRASRHAGPADAGAAASAGSLSAGDISALLAQAARDIKNKRDKQAHAAYRRILATDADQPDANHGMGMLHEKARHLENAYRFYRAAAANAPHKPVYWRRLGFCLKELKKFEAAAVALRQAIAAAPDNPSYYVDLARLLYYSDETGEAMKLVDQAIAVDPGYARAHYEKGVQEQALANFDAARANYARALECDPGFVEAHYQMVSMRETFGDPETVAATLLDALEDKDLGSKRRTLARFSIGRIRQWQKRHDEAFDAYARGNAEARAGVNFDGTIIADMADRLTAAFTPEAFAELEPAGLATRQPVFIVGMPRSGTTLVEQIISSHPDAGDGGEVPKMAQLAQVMWNAQDAEVRYPRDITLMEPAHLQAVGEDYLAHLREGQPGDAKRITDKLPLNFFNAGLIRVLFPRAAIIHCRRDPMATCLSCFFQNFTDTAALAFTFDQEELGFYYRQYERLMAHWRDVLPGPFMEVQYEELVANQEEMSRALVDFVGLEWDEACLRFHETGHSVKTASQWQVRQPVYTSSVAGWREYEKHLEPLKAALAGEGGGTA